ncbi:MAG: LytTR family transcriptional regulator DNA-binding domain-containing protein [Bacteroidaceae bacterium]|nr:LytTR family transcriptional regulator DNA-binding domain-containing protein [Bacteroidaceae bacterium]
MKQKLLITAYWILMILLTALMLSSLDYTFKESCLLATLLLPGGIVIKFMLPKILLEPMNTRIRNLVLLFITALVIEFLLIFIGHGILFSLKHPYYYEPYFEPMVNNMIVNPIFLTLLLILFSGGDYLLDDYLSKHLKQAPKTITFTSDRKPVTILQADILYVESNDTEVWIHASDGQKYRNKTPISQWENLLGIGFIRIHRSFLVARAHILKSDPDSVTLDNQETLPISKKYQK